MFEDIFVLPKRRDPKQAIGFYIVYTVLGLFLLALLGIIMGLVVGEEHIVEKARRFGQITAVVYPFSLSLVIVQAKSAFSLKSIAMILLSGFLGSFGIFTGLLPTAYLSTLPNNTPTPPSLEEEI